MHFKVCVYTFVHKEISESCLKKLEFKKIYDGKLLEVVLRFF